MVVGYTMTDRQMTLGLESGCLARMCQLSMHRFNGEFLWKLVFQVTLTYTVALVHTVSLQLWYALGVSLPFTL